MEDDDIEYSFKFQGQMTRERLEQIGIPLSDKMKGEMPNK